MIIAELLSEVWPWSQAEPGFRKSTYYLADFATELGEARPWNVDGVIVLPGPARRSWDYFLTFARFRAAYSIIERMAGVLWRPALSTGVIPTVDPRHVRTLRAFSWDTPFVRRIIENGHTLYTGQINQYER